MGHKKPEFRFIPEDSHACVCFEQKSLKLPTLRDAA